MRIVLLVVLLYALLFSLVSLIKALLGKKIKKYKFFGRKSSENAVVVINKEEDPKNYWLLSLMHFVNIVVLAFVIIKFVTL